MKKKSEQKDIKGLNFEIQYVQMEKMMDDFNNSIKRDTAKGLKKLFITVGPLMLATIGFIIFKNPAIILVGSGVTGISSIIILTGDFIKSIKKMEKNNYKYNSKIINLYEDEKLPEEILEEEIARTEEFYTENYKDMLSNVKDNEIDLEKETNFKVVEEHVYLDKEAAMEQIKKEMDMYSIVYKTPPFDILDEHWILFFDNIYTFFENKEIQNDFYDTMSQIAKFVFAKSLVNNKSKISIYDFINNLYYLERKEIKLKEIESLQNNLSSKMSAQIVNFSDYSAGKGRK